MNHELFFIRPEEMKEEIVEGDVRRQIFTGDNIQVVKYYFPPHKVFPSHSHEKQEQMGYLIEGTMGFSIDGEKTELHPGEWYRVPVGVEHNAWTGSEPAVLIDIFSPPRDDLR